MAGPYDYNIQAPDITGSLLGGIAAGQQVHAQQAAQDKAAAYQADLQNYLQNPTARGASAMMAKYPESQKALSASFNTFDKGQKEEIFKAGTQAYSAIQNKRPEIAMKILDDRIKAAENSGQDTADLLSLKESLQRDPNGTGAGLALSMSALNPVAWSAIASEQRAAEKAPAELSLAESKAGKAAVDAKFAESKAVQDLQKGGWEIQKLANDINISKLNSQIAAMNAETSRRGNDLKGQSNNLKFQELQLKLQDKIDKRDEAIRTKSSEASSAQSAADNLLNTADRILQTDPNVVASAAGPVDQFTPTLLPETANFEELVKTLGSQTFLTQVQALKGMGALSEKEGDKIERAAQSLSLRQSPDRLLDNVREIQRLTLKARGYISDKYGVPNITPDRPDLKSQPESSGFKVLGRE